MMMLGRLEVSSELWSIKNLLKPHETFLNLLGHKDILTPHEALLSLLSHRLNAGESSNMEVRAVDLGYHSSIYNSDQAWQAWPVWRIRTSVGDFKVNAVSGSIIEQ